MTERQHIPTIDLAWEAVNALGGASTEHGSYDHGYVDAITAALEVIEKLGGKDPLPQHSRSTDPAVSNNLLQLLDDVSATAESMFEHYKHLMTQADRVARRQLIKQARAVCDAELRPEPPQPDDDGSCDPLHGQRMDSADVEEN
jgi:hypothetical protein